MKTTFLIFIFSIITANSFAQKEVFGLVKYNAPKGWKKELGQGMVMYTVVDKKDKTWCQLGIYKSGVSKGSLEKDFNADWKELICDTYKITDTAIGAETTEAGGWKMKTGSGKFTFNNKPAAAMLITFSGYDKSISIVAVTGNERYLRDIQDLIASIELTKPSAGNLTGNNQTATVAQSGFAFSSTNFDDGWTSVIKEDWVEVTKRDMKVYLLYALPYSESNFSGTGLMQRDYYWDNYVSKYFNIQTKQYQDDGEVIGGLKPLYVEGWATDRQTGEKRFIAMRLSISPNTAYLVIASAKDEVSVRQQFPKANDKYSSDLSAMDGYNRFAISENDILGTWQDGNTSTMQWYYTAPSGYEGYAGMTVAARSATFNFNGGGNYTSIHNGATGAVGAMSTFQQNYKGKYTVTNWSITATNRWDGKTENFNSWFKALRGGRILCMDAGGMQYRLLKTK